MNAIAADRWGWRRTPLKEAIDSKRSEVAALLRSVGAQRWCCRISAYSGHGPDDAAAAAGAGGHASFINAICSIPSS